EPSTTALVSTTVPINSRNKNGMEEGNIGTCSTPIGTTAPNTGSVSINITDSPTIDLINTVSLESIRATSEWFTNTAYGFSWESGWLTSFSKDGLDAMLNNSHWFIRNNPLFLKKWNPDGRSSFARTMIELQVDVKLKGTIVVAMPKLVGESNLNSFDALNSVENDDDLGTNEGISKLAGKGANFGRFPPDEGFFHVASSSTSTTPIVERIDKLERQIIDEKFTLVDDDGNPLPNVVSMANVNSGSEVEDVVDEHAILWHQHV
ncbi:hypothetical protein Tco_1014940, partial [Tanacetum coccineum]